jgi:transcriptional regulator with XRE-family HTH domain
MGLTQEEFASALRISVKTQRSWEQGRREPSGPAMRLLQLAAKQLPGLGEPTIDPNCRSVAGRSEQELRAARARTRGSFERQGCVSRKSGQLTAARSQPAHVRRLAPRLDLRGYCQETRSPCRAQVTASSDGGCLIKLRIRQSALLSSCVRLPACTCKAGNGQVDRTR